MSKAPYLPTVPLWRLMQGEAIGQGMTCICREAGFPGGRCECTDHYRPYRIGPEVVAAAWAIDATQTDNDNVAPEDFEWRPERLDWRGRWRNELEGNAELAWLMEYAGPEAVYDLARLSEGEKDAIRMHHEGLSAFDIALDKAGLKWDSPSVIRWRSVGASNEEIALRLGFSVGTVKSQLQRARVKLRKLRAVVDRNGRECNPVGDIHDRSFFSASVYRQDGGLATSSHKPEAA